MALSDVLATGYHIITTGALFAIKGGYHVSTLSATAVLDDSFPFLVGFDPGGGARDVTLEGTAVVDLKQAGKFRIILNRADNAENLVCKDFGGNTIGTVSQNEFGIFYNDKTTGWALVCLVTIALA